jgi:hypothetical protein
MYSVWRHKKTGGLYVVIGVATVEGAGARVVVYVSRHTGQMFTRPYPEFMDGRFEAVA